MKRSPSVQSLRPLQTRSCAESFRLSLCKRSQRRFAGIFGLLAQLLLDAQQLVVFRGAIGARERTGLDLTAIGGDGKIGDGRVFGLAGMMRHDRGVAGLERHL